MGIRELHDWTKQSGLIPAGAHLQEAVDAIRELQRQISQFSDPEEFVPQERFLAILTNGPTDNYQSNAAQNDGKGADWPDYRYWVKRVLIFGSGPNALVATGADFIDEDVPATGNTPGQVDVYTATNLPEMIVQTANTAMHALPTNETFVVEVFGWWDVGNPQQKHYFFSACPAIAWLQPGSPLSGSGYYSASLITGPPQTLDPTVDLVVPITPYETASSGTVVLQNWSEAGKPKSNWGFNGPVSGWYIGMSNESPARPVYRCISAAPGPFKVTLNQVGGSDGDASTPASWTYDVFAFGTMNKIGTALSVARPRISNGPMVVATVGWAEWDTSGTLILDEAWEVHGSNTCVAIT